MNRARSAVHMFPVPPAILRRVALLAVIGLTTALAAWPARPGPDRIDAVQLALDTTRDQPPRATETNMAKKSDETRTDTKTTVEGGRVTLIDIGAEPGDTIRVTDAPEHGHVSLNPDGQLALVLSGSDYSGPLDFTVEIDRGNGKVETVRQSVSVSAPEQAEGWGEGGHYSLRTDAQGDSIVEHGDVHREVYASGSDKALSIEDIAALEGIPAGRINGAWLAENPEYGTAKAPLDPEAAGLLWREITTDGPSSHHLLLESGYDYDMPRLVRKGVSGESEVAPIYVGAWGEGDPPRITTEQRIFQETSQNIVFDGVEFTDGFTALNGRNILLEDVTVSGDAINVQNVENFTLRDSMVVDVTSDAPSNGSNWRPHKDRESGVFISKSDGVLLEGNLFHHNGWEDGYRADGRNPDAQTPSMFSHNVYIQYNTTDVTFRDNVTAQGASFGAQIRGGGHVVDNLFLDNNIGLNVLGGNNKDKGTGFAGNFSLLQGNVVTSAGHLEVDQAQGALARGIDNGGLSTTMEDNVVAHLANPADAKEQSQKAANNGGLRHLEEPETDDTIVYNWTSTSKIYRQEYQEDRNTEGLDGLDLDDVTIQVYAEEVLGADSNTIDDLMDYLRVLYSDGHSANEISADEITEWFLAGFGQDTAPASNGVARFVPREDSDGIRWDNRLNWEDERMPGTAADLGGNRVLYGGTATLDRVDLGLDGALSVGQGYLGLRDGVTGTGRVEVDGAGQLWTGGGQGAVDYRVEGGRLVFEDRVAPEALAVDARDGQVILTGGTHMTLGAGDVFVVRGHDAQTGFDGAGGKAILEMTDGATLAFGTEGGRFGQVGEFRSGAFGDGPEIASTLVLDGTLRIDLSDLNTPGGRAVETVLLEADEITGQFDRVEVAGLEKGQSADLVLDYDADTLVLRVQGGKGGTEFTTIGGDAAAPEIVRADALPDFGTGWLDGV